MKTKSKLISKKKPIFSVGDSLGAYLERYNQIKDSGIRFENLERHDNAVPLYDEHDKDTLWSTLFYPGLEYQGISDDLLTTYAILKSDGDMSVVAA